MRNPAADESDLQQTDFWCDFCRRPWTDDVAMIEGHQGSILCGRCLTLAYTDIVLHGLDARGANPPGRDDPAAPRCTMCLEPRQEPMWRSPAYEEAWICRRCVKQGATALEKSPDFDWKRPGSPAGVVPGDEDEDD